ncbi:hypothetical protein [Nostoc sp. PA-18-2419]|uniref:hypothetical protein n=1 Tax=Nostoc sp. PA-18-2419 TaxID=2575443 RepID=UPI001674EFC1|nr:hypothetical protein [Nostoc sp. PA-18-2419]
MDLIGVSGNSKEFQSNYVPLISFKTQQEKEVAENYIINKVEEFFNVIGEVNISNIINAKFSYSKSITIEDFSPRTTKIEYFYKNLFSDLEERDKNGKLKLKIKWCITFDIKFAPIEVPQIQIPSSDSKSYLSRRFGTIDIRGTPVLYYIYFTLQELIDVIANRTTKKV